MQFAEALRSRGGVENRSAVMGDERKELFRGKDLVRWVKAHPEQAASAAPPGGHLAGLLLLTAACRRFRDPGLALFLCCPVPSDPCSVLFGLCPAPCLTRSTPNPLDNKQAGAWRASSWAPGWGNSCCGAAWLFVWTAPAISRCRAASAWSSFPRRLCRCPGRKQR